MATRTTLPFKRGVPSDAFVWVSHLNNKVVGLCKFTNCSECKARLSDDFTGGELEVLVSRERHSRRSGSIFHTAHLISELPAPQFSTPAVVPDDRASSEMDATGVTMFVYTDSKTGQSVGFDVGGPLSMQEKLRAKIARYYIKKYGLSDTGLIISHGHLDHWSNVPPEYQGQVYMTPLTSAYMRRGLRFHGIKTQFSEEIFSPGDDLEVGSFRIISYDTPHSIPETCSFLGMTSGGKTFFHQGDAKLRGIHWRDEIVIRQKLAEIGNCGGVDVFHVDNLNCHWPGFTPEESEVCRSVSQLIAANTGRIIIGVFTTNLKRIKALARTALDLGRHVEFAGSGMRFAKGLLEDEGLDFPVHQSNSNNYSNLSPVVFTSGCQAEPESVLWREAEGISSPAQLNLNERDTIILSSHCIPGNEFGITSMVNKLATQVGCRIILNSGEPASLGIESERVTEALTHCSGHGQREDVRTAIELVKPKVVIPSVFYSQQMNALYEICNELGVTVLEPEENHFEL